MSFRRTTSFRTVKGSGQGFNRSQGPWNTFCGATVPLPLPRGRGIGVGYRKGRLKGASNEAVRSPSFRPIQAAPRLGLCSVWQISLIVLAEGRGPRSLSLPNEQTNYFIPLRARKRTPSLEVPLPLEEPPTNPARRPLPPLGLAFPIIPLAFLDLPIRTCTVVLVEPPTLHPEDKYQRTTGKRELQNNGQREKCRKSEQRGIDLGQAIELREVQVEQRGVLNSVARVKPDRKAGLSDKCC
ncbi:NADPH-dependent diflavin oxidoreductase 1 [Striga asiatica]|uniref:NADPH-dependent diflavin oxidoreductase 1 n=1 Tax=Striga asiatica TaxID=4170 RepID=A0A5A7PZF1_STRAF|nr:NADPH-dependent diflavin oxidoreductase 1 [Striga asiatica]